MGTACRARIEGGISSSQDSSKVGCEMDQCRDPGMRLVNIKQ